MQIQRYQAANESPNTESLTKIHILNTENVSLLTEAGYANLQIVSTMQSATNHDE